jgi:SAM-dependent methyltransferase
MATVAYILLGLVGLIGLVAVIWRIGSRRRSVPCPVWLRWLVELDNPFTKTNQAAVIVERLELEPGMAVLDAGCGPGRLAIPIARQVGPRGEVVAMDIQAGMLERAREKAAAANLANIRFLEGGLGEGKLDRNRFDRSVLVTGPGRGSGSGSGVRRDFRRLEARRHPVRDRAHFRSPFPASLDGRATRAFGRISRASVPRQSHCIHVELAEAP